MNNLNSFQMKNLEWILLLLSLSSFSQTPGNGAKDINGKLYKSVIIGKQEWMIENLNVEKFSNGDFIAEALTNEEWEKAAKNKQPAWCYYNNDPANGKKYGKLYNWFAVNDSRGLAPKGWHIPSDAEWAQLINYLDGGYVATQKMKNTRGWLVNGTNESGFLGLPGGYFGDRHFGLIGQFAYWWSSTEDTSISSWNYSLSSTEGYSIRDSFPKAFGSSVRCIKD
jgi:uncharacterized protein (TIGR02145 family)